jgi:NAD(P)-dependent dehydrogenase (short-subunit alcohol dehydrogenase family)
MRGDAGAIPQYLQILARLHARIHAHPANEFGNLKGWLATSIARAMLLDKPRRQILLNGLRDMPDGDRLCHGDFHPMNVLGKASQPIVIDWPNACRGDPAGDACRSYLILKLHADEVSGSYLDAYCQVTCVPRRTILDWLPYAAAARLMEASPASNIAYWNSCGRCDYAGRRPRRPRRRHDIASSRAMVGASMMGSARERRRKAMGQVDGKVAIVTGGASGIGAVCAATLAREGAKVVVTDLDDTGGRDLVDKISGTGGEAIFLHQDVSLEESWPGVIEATERRFGRLNVMVANAGIGILCKAVEMSLADWRRQTAVNLDGVFLSVKYAVPAMRRAGGGSIIITSSTAGLRGSAGLAGYCATKGGVRLFAKAVAMECAVESDGIRVNTIHPGVIDTPIWTKLPTSSGSNAPIDPNEVAKAGVPLGRAGQAQDIANGVLFLASDASSYMTGAELVIDGGMTGGARPRWT